MTVQKCEETHPYMTWSDKMVQVTNIVLQLLELLFPINNSSYNKWGDDKYSINSVGDDDND